jgi:hypothetical protein
MDPYNPKSPKKDAINFFDMGTFALARFDRVAALKKYLDTSCRWGKPGRGAPGRHALTVWRLSQSIWAPGCRLGMWAAHNC